MRTILLNLDPNPGLAAALQTALLVARLDGGYVEGLHVRPSRPDVIVAGADGFIAAAPDLVAGFEREAKGRSERAIAAFTAFMTEEGLRRPGDGDEKGWDENVSADWRVDNAEGGNTLAQRGRLFDLIVVARPVDDWVGPGTAALETALFESGGPVLVAPPKPPRTLGRHVVVAWNGASETARTIGLGIDLLRRAERVTVLTVENGSVQGPTGDELTQVLRRRDIEATYAHVPLEGASVGGRLLAMTAELGGDLLFKGAYTQSRLRQMIFGGATSHILAHADLPVFMAN